MDTALPWPISVSTSSNNRSADVGTCAVWTVPWSSWKSIRWASALVWRTMESARPEIVSRDVV